MKQQTTGYRLPVNDCSYSPRYIVSYDVATIRKQSEKNNRLFHHSFLCGTAFVTRIAREKCSGTRRLHFTDPKEFWRLLSMVSGYRHTTWGIAHNALHDLRMLGFQSKLEDNSYSLDKPRSKRNKKEGNGNGNSASSLAVIDGPPTIIGLRNSSTQGRLVFVDTLNWFNCTESDLAATAGFHEAVEPDTGGRIEDYLAFTEQRAEIVLRTFLNLRKWVLENDMGMFRYTAAGQANSAYRHRFMAVPILIHDNSVVKQIERNSYFGGRTEVFRAGRLGEDVWQYDVNALFPFVMATTDCPSSLLEYDIVPRFRAPTDGYCYRRGVAEVLIRTKTPIYPLRGFGPVTYPTGEFRTTLAGRELETAHRLGHIIGVKSYARYEVCDLFSKWVNSLSHMRNDYRNSGNRQYECFAKLLLNALYGKFGQMSQVWSDVDDTIAPEAWTQWRTVNFATGDEQNFRSFGWQVQKEVGKKELANTFVAISSFITAAARCYMNELREIAGIKNVYYQATDSLIVNRAGHDRLNDLGYVDPSQLGKLKLEAHGNFAHIYGCNDYVIGGKVVISGRSAKTIREQGERIMQCKFAGSAELFSAADPLQVSEEVSDWKRTGKYDKGIIQPDGWVTPYHITGSSAVTSDSKSNCDSSDAESASVPSLSVSVD